MTDSQQPTRGLMRRVVIRGGPGSGHFGHEGRPGQVGGSQPGDFHSEEPARNERINASYIEDRLGFSPTADDVVGVESKFPVKGISASDLDMSDINQAEFWLGPNGQLYPMFGDVRHADAARDAMSDWYGTQEKRIAPMLSLGPSKMRPDWTSLFYRQTIDFMGDKRSAFHPIAIGSPWPGSESLRWAQESGEVLGFLSKEDSTKPSTVYGLGKNFLFEELLREAGYDPEYLLAAHGFVRVSRGGTRGSKAVGLTWDATIPPTESQRRVIMDVVNQSVEDGGTIVYEAVNATNSIPGTEGVITAEEWPSQRRAFVAGLRGDYKQANIVRSLPDWVLTLMIRGGPGSGHFGHEGRPGQVGGSQPDDFHSAVGALPGDIDREAMKVAMNNIPVGPKDAAWLEDWFADATDVVDPTQNESLVGPSGIAYGVAGMGGHDAAGSEALTKLGQAKLDAGEVPPITATVFDGSELAIELFDETVGPEQDGWERDENGTLAFQFITHMAGEAFPIRLTVEKQEDGKYAIITRSARGSVRFDMLASRVGSAQEIAGSDRFAHFESEEKAKQFMEALVFGKASTFTIDVIGSGEGTRSYFFARVPPEALEAVGLDPSKNIVPEYNWTDAHVPPILASTEEDAAEQLVKYVESRTSESAGRNFALSGGAAGNNITGEDAILAMGFLRISRMGGERGPDVGISWNAAAGLTDAQRRVAVKVAKDTVERDGRMAFERSGAYEPTRQRFGNRVSGAVPPFPDNYFTSVLQGKSLALRSHDGIPAWALRVLIQRGGPGSGHFGHAGRPGEVGGSAPGDFHSSPVDYPEWVDSDEMKKKVAEGLAKAVAKWVTHGNVVGRGNASSNFSGRGWMAHDGTLYLAPTEHLTLANMALRSATSGTPKDWGNAEMVLKRMGFGRMVITSDEFYYNGPDKVMPEQGETINALLATRRESVFAETPNHAGATRPGKEGDDREYLDKMVDAAYRLVGRSRPLVERGGAGSGHFKHEGRQGARGGSEPGDRLPKDRGEQMKQAKQDFHSATPTKREPVGAPAAHIGPGYRMNMTADAFSKYRPAVSAALEWAAREFKQTFGGQVEGVTVHDDPVAFIEANDPEMYAESMSKLDEEGKREVDAGLRQDFGKSLASYNPETKQMLVNVGKHIKPDGALDTDSVMGSATHEFVHWATFGSGRDEIWKEVKVPQGFKDIFWGPYSKDLIQQEYVARVVSSEMRGSDVLTLPGDIVTLAMTDEDHKNARLLMDKISNAFVAPNLEMPTTLRVSPERLVDVTVPDGLGNFWGRAVPESQLDSLPAGSTVNAIYAMLKGEEAFEEGRTIRPDVLSLNWLDETDPARHPVRQQITKKPRLDDVTVAIRSQDNVLERVLDTIGGALRELMGMKHG